MDVVDGVVAEDLVGTSNGGRWRDPLQRRGVEQLQPALRSEHLDVPHAAGELPSLPVDVYFERVVRRRGLVVLPVRGLVGEPLTVDGLEPELRATDHDHGPWGLERDRLHLAPVVLRVHDVDDHAIGIHRDMSLTWTEIGVSLHPRAEDLVLRPRAEDLVLRLRAEDLVLRPRAEDRALHVADDAVEVVHAQAPWVEGEEAGRVARRGREVAALRTVGAGAGLRRRQLGLRRREGLLLGVERGLRGGDLAGAVLGRGLVEHRHDGGRAALAAPLLRAIAQERAGEQEVVPVDPHDRRIRRVAEQLLVEVVEHAEELRQVLRRLGEVGGGGRRVVGAEDLVLPLPHDPVEVVRRPLDCVLKHLRLRPHDLVEVVAGGVAAVEPAEAGDVLAGVGTDDLVEVVDAHVVRAEDGLGGATEEDHLLRVAHLPLLSARHDELDGDRGVVAKGERRAGGVAALVAVALEAGAPLHQHLRDAGVAVSGEPSRPTGLDGHHVVGGGDHDGGRGRRTRGGGELRG